MKELRTIAYCATFISLCSLFGCKDEPKKGVVENFDISEIQYKRIMKTVDSIDISKASERQDTFLSKSYKEDGLAGRVKYIYERKYPMEEMQDRFNKKKDAQPANLIFMEFDEKGNKLFETKYDKRNNPISTESYTYDNAGNCTQQVITDNSNNHVEYYTNYTYQNGLLTDESIVYSSAENSVHRKITYDSLKRFPAEIISYNYNNEIFNKNVYTYDSESCKISHMYEYNKKGILVRHHLYRYNLYKQLRAHHTFNSRKEPEKSLYYKYEYDSKFNWVTRVEYRNGSPMEILRRKIVYFQ